MSAYKFLGLGVSPSAVEPVEVPFGEWLPDLPDRNNPGAIEALNVIPAEGSYLPFSDLAPYGPTYPEKVKGAFVAFDKQGKARLYAAGLTSLGMRQGFTFTNLYTPTTTLVDANYWQFVTFNDYIVAIHPQLVPQAGEVGVADPFVPLGGSPPTATCGARIGNFLVLGNLLVDPDDSNGLFPRRIRWGAFDSIDGPWVTDAATQADFQDMPAEGGAVVGITGREFGTVFQERLISRMTYAGLPTVFDIETVETDRGALNGGCLVDLGGGVFYIANDGFFLWNGTNSTPIGDNKVNRWFFNRLNYAQRRRILGAVDYVRGCIMWAFPTGGSSELTEVIIFSYREQRWSHAELSDLEYFFSGATTDLSLDAMTGMSTDDPVDFPGSLDDLMGGRPMPVAFDTSHNFCTLQGASLAATIDTAESSGPGGTRLFVNAARPLVDVGTAVATVSTARRDQLLGDAVVFDTAVAQEINGECPVIADARYMRFRVGVPAGAAWTHATGVEVWRKMTGRV